MENYPAACHLRGEASCDTVRRMFTGVFLGLVAAFCQSTSYLCMRVFAWKYRRGALDLLAYAHVIMGLFALVLFPFVIPQNWPPFMAIAPAMLGSVVFYFVGQIALMQALMHADASWVSPLLGLKIILLALITTSFLGRALNWLQWTAAGITVLATFSLGQSRGRFSGKALAWVLFACCGYSISDLCIKALADPLVESAGLLKGGLAGASMSYILAGIFGAALALSRPRAPAKVWLGAMPFAIAWFIAMLFLFACFAAIGVVYGNIVQATRGIISVALGAMVAVAGLHHLEERVSRGLLARRIMAAMLMAAAIALFQFSSHGK